MVVVKECKWYFLSQRSVNGADLEAFFYSKSKQYINCMIIENKVSHVNDNS